MRSLSNQNLGKVVSLTMDLVGGPQKIFHKILKEKMHAIESYLIANGIVKTYEDLNLDRVKYLGIVVDSDEARETSKVIELLEWLSDIGVKKVCLYDKEGVLKKSKEVFLEKFDFMKTLRVQESRVPLTGKCLEASYNCEYGLFLQKQAFPNVQMMVESLLNENINKHESFKVQKPGKIWCLC
uniref:ditrans,polycis-polyprenyl diphosphate synthase [(2E,6E)-farnesyldiphosphate specific] n=1 Tax=Lactuca sativa TaxID=4236 RepID=A0A9R1UCY5_LACSA|nr:hypothetical protein LSAT_V11C900475000 [Lactuca sativa]